MKNKMKTVLLPLMLLLVVCLFCACSRNKTRLDEVDAGGYNVSVRFEANGGEFTTNCYSIVDAYNISGMKTNAEGKVELSLISPDNAVRGANDTFTVQKAGYFLAGWYERTETVDSEGKTVYSYTNKWDFENGKLKVDPNKSYNVNDPVITLYAVWVPQFEVNFINKDTGEQIKNMIVAPEESTLSVPHYDENTGKMKMYKFPELADSTFVAAYKLVNGEYVQVNGTLEHSGYVDDNGNAVNPVMDVYVEYKAGKHFEIYTAKQLAENASSSGIYHIMADLDFTDVTWPSIFGVNKEFNGQIIGNGHTISNVTMEQNKIDSMNMGLFAKLGADAQIKDVTFENVTMKITKGFKTLGSAYGLFAGSINSDAVIENVQLTNSQILIYNNAAFMTKEFDLGLISGTRSANGITWSAENVRVIEVDAAGEPVAAGSELLTIDTDDTGYISVTTIETT